MGLLCFHHNSGFITLALVTQVHRIVCIVAWCEVGMVAKVVLFGFDFVYYCSSRLSRRFAMNYFYNCTLFLNTKKIKGTANSVYSHSKLVLLN